MKWFMYLSWWNITLEAYQKQTWVRFLDYEKMFKFTLEKVTAKCINVPYMEKKNLYINCQYVKSLHIWKY